MHETVKWDEEDAIKVLEEMKWPPMRGDSCFKRKMGDKTEIKGGLI